MAGIPGGGCGERAWQLQSTAVMMRERWTQRPLPIGPWLIDRGPAPGEASDVLLEFMEIHCLARHTLRQSSSLETEKLSTELVNL